MIADFLSQTIGEVYDMIGSNRMTYYFVPYITKGYKNSQDYIDYDFENKIKVRATINALVTGDPDLESARQYLKTTSKPYTVQFLLDDIKPLLPRMLDMLYVEYDDGRKEKFLLVGIDNDLLLQGIYMSYRAFKFDGTITKFQWTLNGEKPQDE